MCAAGRAFGADLVVYTSDHAAGRLTAVALAVPALEVGNRISWSMRDQQFRVEHGSTGADEIGRLLRAKLDIEEGDPKLVARIDPRAPSMGGLSADEPDQRDGVPWWSMRFVPYKRRRCGAGVGTAPARAASGMSHAGHCSADHGRHQQPVRRRRRTR
ncbi:MAG TPA: hypothetical protein VIY28_14230 [Pseudonocardiaceae bacterium]